jgi:hypothetical protein
LKYYGGLQPNFKLREWTFRGLINAIGKSKASAQTKFLLLAIIDLLQGKISREVLSFFQRP